MTPTRWSRGTILAGVAFVSIALLQVGLPIRAAFDERPARYGWQMYSTVSQAPEVYVEDSTGRRSPVDPLALMADPRAEVRWAPLLVERLCRDPAVAAVVVRERGDEERVTCS